MAQVITGRRGPTKVKKHQRAQKRKRDDVNVEKLQQAVDDLDVKATTFTNFPELPLCEPTKAGLKASNFSTLTDIQAKAIPLALKGADILGAAKTGSGKTLAFVIPVLENLYRQQCIGPDAGLGAMIISPTRELAIQIFDVLYKIGKCGHMFAAGLIIGGKSLKEEQHALSRMNIVVCTPGRMLQHLSQTADFSVDNLAMLVLDEADRIMDMGFQRDVDAIIEYLPRERQTLLFSATQTKRVSDLARLSLREPEYVSVHETAATATPKSLQQNYVLTPLPEKLDTLWSFILSSKKSKILVFLSSGKQVRFVYESFRKLQPGIPLLHLHGRQKQTARLEITSRFAAARYSCLFATDVVARGLDFPAVDWVVQVDCPEDADTYIHRVGRTARYERDGRAVLFLDPSEEQGMLERLTAKKVPIEQINIRAKKQQSIQNQLQSMCFKNPELKYLGQKAFASYVRSIHLQKDKEIFNIESYALAEFATNLGLPGAPKIKFLKADNEAARKAKNAPRQDVSDAESAESGEQEDKHDRTKKNPVRTKYDRMFERQNQDILSNHYGRMVSAGDDENGESLGDSDPAAQQQDLQQDPISNISAKDDDDDEQDDLFRVKQRFVPSADPEVQEKSKPLNPTSNRQIRALKSRKATAKLLGKAPTKLVFDEDGGSHEYNPFKSEQEAFNGRDVTHEREEARKQFVTAEREKMVAVDGDDARVAKEKRRAKREKKKQRERESRNEDKGDSSDGDDGSPWIENIKRPFEELQDLYSDDDGDAGATTGEFGRAQNHQDEEGGSSGSDDDYNGRSQTRFTEPQNLENLERLATGILDTAY